MRVLEINAIFGNPTAAPVVDGPMVAAAEGERFSRRKRAVPISEDRDGGRTGRGRGHVR